jgi:hypothetical protein
VQDVLPVVNWRKLVQALDRGNSQGEQTGDLRISEAPASRYPKAHGRYKLGVPLESSFLVRTLPRGMLEQNLNMTNWSPMAPSVLLSQGTCG